MTQIALPDAETQLAALVRQAETGEAVTLEKRPRNFWDEIQEWRSTADFEPVDLTDEEIASWRDRSPAREFSWPE